MSRPSSVTYSDSSSEQFGAELGLAGLTRSELRLHVTALLVWGVAAGLTFAAPLLGLFVVPVVALAGTVPMLMKDPKNLAILAAFLVLGLLLPYVAPILAVCFVAYMFWRRFKFLQANQFALVLGLLHLALILAVGGGGTIAWLVGIGSGFGMLVGAMVAGSGGTAAPLGASGVTAVLSLVALPVGALVSGAVATGALHLSLRELYKRGYRTDDALGLMALCVVTVIAMVAPLLGVAADGFDGSPEPGTPDAPVAETGGTPSSPSTTETYVQPHLRTAPDGIVENNLSFRGYVPEGTPDPPGYVHVDGYVRGGTAEVVPNPVPLNLGAASTPGGAVNVGPVEFAVAPAVASQGVPATRGDVGRRRSS
jgi:hypothetical protein